MIINACAGIVVYNPDISRLIKSISALLLQIEHVVLVNNNSTNMEDLTTALRKENLLSRINFINNYENRGIAYALNQIIAYSAKMNFDWVLTLDQDSIVDKEIFRHYHSVLNEFHDPIGSIGILAPKHTQRINLETLNYSAYETNFAITSGSLTNIKAAIEVGGFDNKLFIDAVDWEFCIRLRNIGKKILAVNNTYIEHQLGKSITINMLGASITKPSHLPIRYFYLNRNVVILTRRYIISNFKDCLWMLQRTTNKNLGLLLIEKQKFSRIKSILQGIVSGLLIKTSRESLKL
jgi:rhamnosyltransferase